MFPVPTVGVRVTVQEASALSVEAITIAPVVAVIVTVVPVYLVTVGRAAI
jgi:hypothetical protein